ncbi:MAG: DNA repair protein RecO, partial [Gemmatimonadota bacterium]|nr:DNA repair protein RecO [Gemmatimonadota bacterium]
MPLLVSDAIVLHAFDYLESSRILRLATREGGVRSALAKGARRSQRRFGSALDLFAQGSAQLSTRTGRDLDTLAGFDVVASRAALAEDLGRFAGASAIAELVLHFQSDHADPALFDALAATLDAIAAAPPSRAVDAALAGAWRVIGALGFAPALAECAECNAPLDDEAPALFSHAA